MHCLNQNKIFTNRFQYAGTKFCSVCAKRFCVNLSAAHALDHLCQAIWEVSNWHFSQLVLWSAIIILELCKKILNIFIFMVKVVSCIYYFFFLFFFFHSFFISFLFLPVPVFTALQRACILLQIFISGGVCIYHCLPWSV